MQNLCVADHNQSTYIYSKFQWRRWDIQDNKLVGGHDQSDKVVAFLNPCDV